MNDRSSDYGGVPYESPVGFPGMYAPFGNLSQSSPYLSIDPAIFRNEQPQYIMPEGAAPKRGRFELAFSQIGGSVMTGAALGGANGLLAGFRDPEFSKLVNPARRTQMLNLITKQGAAYASTLGVVAVMYSGFGVLMSWWRGADDEVNTLSAATLTGLLYKSSAGLKRALMGGGLGFSIAGVYCLYTSGDRLKKMIGR